MVSFQCESCGDVLTKKKLDPHRGRCRGASFSCIDCMTHFHGTDYRSHTTCMTEDQKYQGALYKNKNKKARFNPPSNEDDASHFATPATPAAPAASSANMAAAVRQYYQPPAHAAFVEDVPEELESYLVADNDENAGPSDDDAPPHAPTPPPADEADDNRVNVFDFLVGATPNGSSLELAQAHAAAAAAANPSGLGFDYDVNAFLDSPGGYAAAAAAADAAPKRQLIDYGSSAPPAPLPATAYQTPGPIVRTERKKKDKDSSADKDTSSKKDKKRKRLYLDIHDQVMADAPPVLHSGLTGGLNRMSTKSPAVYPPSPASAAETPASPLKKTKHAKNRSPRTDATAGNSLFSILAGAAAGSKTKTKTKKRKHHASSPTSKKHSKTHRHHHHRHHHGDKDAADSKKAPKLLEYHKKDDDAAAANAGQMVVFRPRADLFMSFVDKGSDSERGCSMNKALKRFHRERSESGNALVKSAEEKELFRSLRLRKNDRGEIVLFCIDDAAR